MVNLHRFRSKSFVTVSFIRPQPVSKDNIPSVTRFRHALLHVGVIRTVKLIDMRPTRQRAEQFYKSGFREQLAQHLGRKVVEFRFEFVIAH
jgi:hypothetical protein